jgi:hypothetical protein
LVNTDRNDDVKELRGKDLWTCWRWAFQGFRTWRSCFSLTETCSFNSTNISRKLDKGRRGIEVQASARYA